VILKVGKKKYFKELFVMRGSMSFIDSRLNFGLGKDSIVDDLTIIWPDNKTTNIKNIKANQFLSYVKDDKNLMIGNNSIGIKKPIFNDVSYKLGIRYNHKENNFVDFDRERLLYHMKSNEGPKITVADINGDGMERLLYWRSKR
jgi:hypothetical protein